METFKDVLDRWENRELLASDIRQKGVTVRQWGNRDNIPSEYWNDIVSAAQSRGYTDVTLELLASIAAGRRRPGSSEDAAA